MKYVTSTEGITVDMLSGGFFDGWPNPPSCEIHLQILQRSDFVVLAIDESSSNIAGFISAITDDVLSHTFHCLKCFLATGIKVLGMN